MVFWYNRHMKQVDFSSMTKEELESFGYENMGNNIYEENHIMRLRQATTNYWKERFARFGKEIIYLEFEYPWQEGMNRLFVYQS